MAMDCALAIGLFLGWYPFTQSPSHTVQAAGPFVTTGLAPASYM